LAVSMFRFSTEAQQAYIWLQVFYFAAALIAVSFYFFARTFPSGASNISWFVKMAVVLTTGSLGVVLYRFGTVNEIFISSDSSHAVNINLPIYIIYSIFFVTFIVLSFIHLFGKHKKETSYNRKAIKITMLPTFMAAVFGSFFDLFLPLITYKYIWIGPIFTMLMVVILVKSLFIDSNQ